MKKKILLLLVTLSLSNLCQSQEWMTNLDVAKRLASVQNKMLFMMWEEATWEPYPVSIKQNNRATFVNLFDSEYVNEKLWEHFIPVRVGEYMYDQLFKDIEGKRKQSYINRFNDDSIKIMDINGNILDTYSFNATFLNLDNFIKIYALNTSYLKQELKNYRGKKNFFTAFRLASKYIDYALFVNKRVRKKMIDLADVYIHEADTFLQQSTAENKAAFIQKSKLLKLKRYLILNKPKRVLKSLNKLEDGKVHSINKPLVAFLYHTSYRLQKDKEKSEQWKSQVSLVDLKYTQMIVNINK